MKERIFYEIDGFHFTSEEYDFEQGWPLFAKLLQICGKAVLSFLFEGLEGLLKGALSGEESKQDLLSMQVTEVLSKLDKTKIVDSCDSFFQRLDPSSMMPLTSEILSKTDIVTADKKHRPIDFKIDLKGEYGTVIKLLRKVLVYQYQSSFQKLLSGLAEPIKSAPVQTIGTIVKAKPLGHLKSTGGSGV